MCITNSILSGKEHKLYSTALETFAVLSAYSGALKGHFFYIKEDKVTVF